MEIEKILVEHAAPTLAGLKTANLFSLQTNGENPAPQIRKVNKMLSEKGLRLIPLRKMERGILVYLYRPALLRQDLSCPEAACILQEKGYPCQHPDQCIVRLIHHLAEDEAFPHEIGLFLGYPPSDVKGFMNSSKEGVKCVGCWKAYGNEEEAEKTFARYKHCTNVYCRELKNGRPLERLVVDTRNSRRYRDAYRGVKKGA